MADNLLIGNLFDIAGRWVAITGAASGIGRMLSRGCAANSANTILIDVNDDGLAETAAQLRSFSSAQIETITGDLSSESGIKAVANKIKAKTSSLDALVHCAAVRYMNGITYTPGDGLNRLEAATISAPYQGWETTFRVNVLAPYFLTAHLIGPLGKAASSGDGRGCVILLSSPASVHNNQFVPCYQTSKAAVDHLTRIMAAEFADFYIRVNCMSPGIVPSGMTTTDANSNLHLASETPAKRPGTEDDMVGCALWLMSKAGAFMDGKVVRVEGGRLLILKGMASNSD